MGLEVTNHGDTKVRVAAGKILVFGQVLQISNTVLDLVPNTLNYIFIDLIAGVATSNTMGFPSSCLPLGTIRPPLYGITNALPDYIISTG